MFKTTNFLPKTEAIRKQIRIPYAITLTPTSGDSPQRISCKESDLISCSRCHSFFSNFSQIESNKWKCQFCGTENLIKHSENFVQAQQNDFEIILESRNDSDQAFIIYISLGFNSSDITKAKLFAISLLRHLPENSKCFVIIGSDEFPLSLLTPPQMDQSEIHENVLNCLLQASITNFPSVESLIGLDLSHFYFTSKNSASAERTIDNLIPSKDSDPHKKCAVLAQMFSSFLSNASIRFFSIVNEITRKTIDLEPIRISPIRFDFIVNKVNQYAIKFASELPGSLIELSEENISLQAIHFLGQECKFQMVLKYKSKGARLTWLKPMRPFIDSNSQTVFLPVCITKSYPFVFEITPEFTRSDSSYFQFVSKYIRYTGNISELIMRVQSISIPTTENITDIINSIQWNDILLFWARKVVGKTTREVMPSLVRTAALLENQIGAKPNEELRKAVCSFEAMKALNEKKEDSFRYIDLICNSSPNMLSMIPKIQSGMCESFNGVYEERNPKEKGPSKEARKRQMQMEVFLPVGDKIPNEFKTLLPIYEKVFVEMAKK